LPSENIYKLFKRYIIQSETFIRYKKIPTVKGKAALSNYYAKISSVQTRGYNSWIIDALDQTSNGELE
jgi:hypothetical protein